MYGRLENRAEYAPLNFILNAMDHPFVQAVPDKVQRFRKGMRRFGGEQVRNAGTIGANIANGSQQISPLVRPPILC